MAGAIRQGRVAETIKRFVSTMVYSEVLNMLTIPDDYIGKIIRVHGWTAS